MKTSILICGARRSGTTLMMAVLCSDTRANRVMPECHVLTKLVEAYQQSVSQFDNFVAPLLGSKSELDRMYSRWTEELVGRIRQHAGDPDLLVLKHPAILRHLSALRALLPEANPLVMVRDPRDQVASELEVAARAGHQRPPTHRLAERLADSFKGFDDSPCMTVRYEDLVCDFPTVKSLLETTYDLRLTFDPNKPWPDVYGLNGMRHFPAWSVKYGAQVDSHSVGRYRNELTTTEIATVEDICDAYMRRFGYSVVLRQ